MLLDSLVLSDIVRSIAFKSLQFDTTTMLSMRANKLQPKKPKCMLATYNLFYRRTSMLVNPKRGDRVRFISTGNLISHHNFPVPKAGTIGSIVDFYPSN